MTYLSFLDRPRGREIARMNANPTSNTLSIEPQAVIGDGPPSYCLLFRRSNLELANVTLSGSLSITSDGYLDVVGGPQAGSISVTTDPSGNTYTDITQIRVKDDQGLFALNPATGIAEIQYANVNIIASQSLRGPNVFVDNIDVSEGSNVYYDADLVHLFGTKGTTSIINSGLDQTGSTLRISGTGVGQYLPSSLNAATWPGGVPGAVFITPISATQPCTTVSNPATGFTFPPIPAGDITTASATTIPNLNQEDKAALEIYGDSSGPVPSYAPAGYVPIQWYDKAPQTTTKTLVAQRNLHFSETNVDTIPPLTLPADPYAQNVLEVRNYAGPNVFAESYIGIYSKDAPWDTKLNRWEWKVHDNYNIDMLPISYKSNINEVNKISHIVDYGSGKTHVSFATNLTGGTDVGFIFDPTAGTKNNPALPPDGTFSLNIAANTIFDADANELVVQRTKNASATNSAALRVVGGLGIGRNSHFGDSIFINSNVSNDSVMTIRPHDRGTGFTEITYDSSNVITLTIPHFGGSGTRQPTDVFSASSDNVILGNDIGFTDSTEIVRGDPFGRRTKITLTDDIDINTDAEEDLASNIYGYTSTNPLIHCENDFVNFHANSFQIYSNLNTDRPIANISQTDVIFGESSNNFSANFKLFSNSAYVFEQTGDHIKIGLQDTAEKAQMYINTTPMSEMYSAPVTAANTFNMWAQSGDGTVGDYRILSTELRRTFLNGNPVAATGTTVTINPDATQYASLRIVNKNGDAVRFGGTPQSDGFGDAITQFGMGLNFHSDTTANLTDGTTFQSRIAKSFVFDETEDTLAWYPGGDSPAFSTLNYLLATDANGDVNVPVSNITITNVNYSNVFEYSNVVNVINENVVGQSSAVNVGTSNLVAETNKPRAEQADDEARIATSIFTPGDGSIYAAGLTTQRFDVYNYLGENMGIDDSDGNFEDGRRIWQYEGRNSILGDKRLIFNTAFAYADGQFTGFFDEEYTSPPSGNILVEGNLTYFNFKQQFAPNNGWISGVQVKFPGPIKIRQGDTTWDGTVTRFTGFAGLYLGWDFTVGGVANTGNPPDPARYLKSWSFTDNTDETEEITIEGVQNIMLPSEKWLYIPEGHPLPYLKFVLFLGTENARIKIPSFDYGLGVNDAFGRCWSGTIMFTTPLGQIASDTDDPRWSTQNLPT